MSISNNINDCKWDSFNKLKSHVNNYLRTMMNRGEQGQEIQFYCKRMQSKELYCLCEWQSNDRNCNETATIPKEFAELKKY